MKDAQPYKIKKSGDSIFGKGFFAKSQELVKGFMEEVSVATDFYCKHGETKDSCTFCRTTPGAIFWKRHVPVCMCDGQGRPIALCAGRCREVFKEQCWRGCGGDKEAAMGVEYRVTHHDDKPCEREVVVPDGWERMPEKVVPDESTMMIHTDGNREWWGKFDATKFCGYAIMGYAVIIRRKPRLARNPRTGEPVALEERNVLLCRFSRGYLCSDG